MSNVTSCHTPFVSIIIPVFNDEAGLQACLNGIAKQSYPGDQIEVVVVDNGSAPPLQLSQDSPFPIQVVRCETPGSYAARNAGSRMARGTVFAFIDADCSPHSGWLREGVRCLLAGKGQWVVGGDVLYFEPATRASAVALYQFETGFGQEHNIRNRFFSVTANLLCSAEQFQTIGPFDERLLSGGDSEWSWRAQKFGIDVCFEPAAIVYTEPRANLPAAIRQARRVAAGRITLRKLGLTHAGPIAAAKPRTTWHAVHWILTRPSLTVGERVRVLCVAGLIRAASGVERLRLAMGAHPERR